MSWWSAHQATRCHLLTRDAISTGLVIATIHNAQRRDLSVQAFAKPERLAEMVSKVKEALQSALPKAVKKMKLYLTNAGTHGILFRPIKSNIAEAHGQIASLLDGEYNLEDADLVQLSPPPETISPPGFHLLKPLGHQRPILHLTLSQ